VKKITGQSKGTHYCSVNLYRDDLEKIIDFLSDGSDRAEISDNNYVYDSIDELLDQRGVKPKMISISSYSPYVSINLKPRSVYLYRSDSEKDSLYAYDRIVEVLKRRRSILSRIFSPAVGISFFSILLFLMIFIPTDLINTWLPDIWSRLSLVALLFGVPILSFFVNYGAFSSVVLLKSYEQKNFFIRQKDDLIKIIVGFVLGALLTLFMSYIKGN